MSIFITKFQGRGRVHRLGRPEADTDQVDGPRGSQLRQVHGAMRRLELRSPGLGNL